MKPDNLEKIIQLRHELHAHPNLSLDEGETMAILRGFLQENTSLEIVGQDGWFYAVKSGSRNEDPTGISDPQSDGAASSGPIAFRADMDALPMDEGIELPYASRNSGVSHKCGHDGHMAALCGLALELESADTERSIYLIFQPAEETGQGAARCAGLIREKGIREIYAFHNLSGYPANSLVYRRDLTQPASEGVTIRFHGKQSHASYPEEGINPAGALAQVVACAQDLPRAYPDETAWSTVVGIACGESDFGISPGEGSVAVTLRAQEETVMKQLEERLIGEAETAAAEAGLAMTYKISDVFPETRNDDAALDRVLASAGKMQIRTIEMKEMWRASEDFGYYLKECPGSIFYIGNGEDHPPLHTREYDFNDGILETAVDVFVSLAKEQ